jgi:hypothetical protein
MRLVTRSLLLLFVACGDNTEPDPTPRIDLEASLDAIDEAGSVTFTVRRMGIAKGEASVDYATADGEATSADYAGASGTLTWADGDTEDKTITISGIEDTTIEANEQFSFLLSNPVGAVLANEAATTITILSNDRIGELLLLTSSGRIVSIDSDSPSIARHEVNVWGIGTEALVGMDRRPADGSLWALSNAGKLYTIDPMTGEATLKSTLSVALSGTDFGVDFNPVPDRLRVTSNTGQNLRINVDTGAATVDGAINGAATGYGAAAYTTSFAAACRTTLYAIDAATDRLLIQNPPNNGTAVVVGTLGIDAGTGAAFDIQTDATRTRALAALTSGGEAALYTIDLASGAASKIGALAIAGGEAAVSMVTATPPASATIAQAPGELYGITDGNRLLSFNRAAPTKPCTSSTISGLATGDSIVGLDFRPSTGALHALANNAGTGKLYTIDPATGVASSPVTLSVALQGTAFGMDFNPTGPVALRIVSDTGQNLRVTDVATGATTADGALNGAGTQAGAAAYTDSIAGAGTTTLFVVDVAADRLRIQNPPNAGTLVDVGALGQDIGALAGFDIDGRDNIGFVAANITGGTATSIHTIDLTTGALSASLGSTPDRLRGITRTPPSTTIFGLTASGMLARISLASPASPAIVGPITGLSAGDSLIGIDVRPSTGLLHGVGALGNIYTIDPVTANATRNAGMNITLSGTEFGLDFNPTGPVALRIVSNAEQNLRIPDVTAGMTNVDGALARGDAQNPDAVAAAYTNSFAGSTVTQLLVIDQSTSTLMRQDPPNNGTLTPIGALSPTLTFSGFASFDIAGGNNGLALAALQITGETASRLYRVNLATGAVTEVGSLGDAFRGLAIQSR